MSLTVQKDLLSKFASKISSDFLDKFVVRSDLERENCVEAYDIYSQGAILHNGFVISKNGYFHLLDGQVKSFNTPVSSVFVSKNKENSVFLLYNNTFTEVDLTNNTVVQTYTSNDHVNGMYPQYIYYYDSTSERVYRASGIMTSNVRNCRVVGNQFDCSFSGTCELRYFVKLGDGSSKSIRIYSTDSKSLTYTVSSVSGFSHTDTSFAEDLCAIVGNSFPGCPDVRYYTDGPKYPFSASTSKIIVASGYSACGGRLRIDAELKFSGGVWYCTSDVSSMDYTLCRPDAFGACCGYGCYNASDYMDVQSVPLQHRYYNLPDFSDGSDYHCDLSCSNVESQCLCSLLREVSISKRDDVLPIAITSDGKLLVNSYLISSMKDYLGFPAELKQKIMNNEQIGLLKQNIPISNEIIKTSYYGVNILKNKEGVDYFDQNLILDSFFDKRYMGNDYYILFTDKQYFY